MTDDLKKWISELENSVRVMIRHSDGFITTYSSPYDKIPDNLKPNIINSISGKILKITVDYPYGE